LNGPGSQGQQGGSSGRGIELLWFYEQNRIADQLRFYRNRREQFDRATGQGLAISATLLGFSSAAGALAGTAGDGPALEADVAELVKRVEVVLRQEQAQWGQLTSQIQITDHTKG
jgi:hypothetical protein